MNKTAIIFALVNIGWVIFALWLLRDEKDQKKGK
jgi:hypothetical protein